MSRQGLIASDPAGHLRRRFSLASAACYNPAVAKADKSKPMPVKHWSFAGLLLTYWCNARCASCYVCSGPDAGGDMSVADGLALWGQLASASPRGCRIHIGGGEPFGRWEALIELARRAQAAGLGPLAAVETNAFWATDERIVRDRLAALDAAGMMRLTISTDPYHQQYVPMERVRLAARVGRQLLGPQRIRLRWRDWAAEGFDTGDLPPPRRQELFAAYARKGRDRLNGRAARDLAELGPLGPARAFAGDVCRQRLLRSRHVHVDGEGLLCPGTCAGIVLGRAAASRPADPPAAGMLAGPIGRIWHRLYEAFADMEATAAGAATAGGPLEVVALLAGGGPTALLAAAEPLGYRPRPDGYAGKCHLCWHVRRWLFGNGYFPGQLAPALVYRP